MGKIVEFVITSKVKGYSYLRGFLALLHIFSPCRQSSSDLPEDSSGEIVKSSHLLENINADHKKDVV